MIESNLGFSATIWNEIQLLKNIKIKSYWTYNLIGKKHRDNYLILWLNKELENSLETRDMRIDLKHNWKKSIVF